MKTVKVNTKNKNSTKLELIEKKFGRVAGSSNAEQLEKYLKRKGHYSFVQLLSIKNGESTL